MNDDNQDSTNQEELEIFATGLGISVYRLIHQRDIYLSMLAVFVVVISILFTITTYTLFAKVDKLVDELNKLKYNRITKEKTNSMRRCVIAKNDHTVVLNLDEFEITKVHDGEKRNMVWTRKIGPELVQWYTYAIVKKQRK